MTEPVKIESLLNAESVVEYIDTVLPVRPRSEFVGYLEMRAILLDIITVLWTDADAFVALKHEISGLQQEKAELQKLITKWKPIPAQLNKIKDYCQNMARVFNVNFREHRTRLDNCDKKINDLNNALVSINADLEQLSESISNIEDRLSILAKTDRPGEQHTLINSTNSVNTDKDNTDTSDSEWEPGKDSDDNNTCKKDEDNSTGTDSNEAEDDNDSGE